MRLWSRPGVGKLTKEIRPGFQVGVTVDTESKMVYWTQNGPPKGNQGTAFSVHRPRSNERVIHLDVGGYTGIACVTP